MGQLLRVQGIDIDHGVRAKRRPSVNENVTVAAADECDPQYAVVVCQPMGWIVAEIEGRDETRG